MNIFVINAGSSSLKYQLFKMPAEQPICVGLIERIGLPGSIITHKVFTGGQEKAVREELSLPDHQAALQEVVKLLTEPGTGVIQDPAEIDVVGHRVVHGGERFSDTTIITPEVKDQIKNLFHLAPLHNPGNFQGLEVAEKLFHKATQVAVFDTAFHQTMPEKAYRYAIPANFYTEHGVRVYGFHGTSHKYVAAKAAEYLDNPNAKVITIHLGNGCSMAAVKAGVCIDTSMGFTPLDGLIMGTRSGAIDASVVFYLASKVGLPMEQIDNLLNKKSGMLGLTGSSDMREVQKAREAGDPAAILAYEMYAYRIQKYIGSYAAALNGLDALVFTAGVGENDALTRELVCQNMEFLGIHLDASQNALRSASLREINTPASTTKVLVIPTNEELEIANQCCLLLAEVQEK
jgi:acetate kinase